MKTELELASPPQALLDWEQQWLERDYSWEGLRTKRAWFAGHKKLQDLIINMEGTEERLRQEGQIVDINDVGPYHVAFIPHHWTRRHQLPFDEEELERRQLLFWKLLLGRVINETFAGHITGVSLGASAANRILTESRASLSWCSLYFGNLQLVARDSVTRSIMRCCAYEPLLVTGEYSNLGNLNLLISESILCRSLSFDSANGIDSVELNSVTLID